MSLGRDSNRFDSSPAHAVNVKHYTSRDFQQPHIVKHKMSVKASVSAEQLALFKATLIKLIRAISPSNGSLLYSEFVRIIMPHNSGLTPSLSRQLKHLFPAEYDTGEFVNLRSEWRYLTGIGDDEALSRELDGLGWMDYAREARMPGVRRTAKGSSVAIPIAARTAEESPKPTDEAEVPSYTLLKPGQLDRITASVAQKGILLEPRGTKRAAEDELTKSNDRKVFKFTFRCEPPNHKKLSSNPKPSHDVEAESASPKATQVDTIDGADGVGKEGSPRPMFVFTGAGAEVARSLAEADAQRREKIRKQNEDWMRRRH